MHLPLSTDLQAGTATTKPPPLSHRNQAEPSPRRIRQVDSGQMRGHAFISPSFCSLRKQVSSQPVNEKRWHKETLKFGVGESLCSTTYGDTGYTREAFYTSQERGIGKESVSFNSYMKEEEPKRVNTLARFVILGIAERDAGSSVARIPRSWAHGPDRLIQVPKPFQSN